MYLEYPGSLYAARGGAQQEALKQFQYAQLVKLDQGGDGEGGAFVPEPIQNFFYTMSDLISRWNFGVAGAFETAMGGGRPGEYVPMRFLREVFSGVGGLEGDKEYFADVFEDLGMEKGAHVLEYIPGYKGTLLHRYINPSVRGLAGFALDVVTDPITWTGKASRIAPKIFDRWGNAKFLTPAGERVLDQGFRKQVDTWAKAVGVAADPDDMMRTLVEVGRTKEFVDYFGKTGRGIIQTSDELAAVQVESLLRREAGYELLESAGKVNFGQALERARINAASSTNKGLSKFAKRALENVLQKSDDALIDQADDALEAAGKLFMEDGLRFRPFWGKLGLDVPLVLDVKVQRAVRKGVGLLAGTIRNRSTRAAAVMRWGEDMYGDLYQAFSRVPFLAKKLPGYERRQAEAWMMRSSAEHVASLTARKLLGELYDRKDLRKDRDWVRAFAKAIEERPEEPMGAVEAWLKLSQEAGLEDAQGLLDRWREIFHKTGAAEVQADLLDAAEFAKWDGHYIPRSGTFSRKDIEGISEMFPQSGKFTGPSLGHYADARKLNSFEDYLEMLNQKDAALLDKVIWDPFEMMRLRLTAHYQAMIDLQFSDDISKMYGLGSSDQIASMRALLSEIAGDETNFSRAQVEEMIRFLNQSGRVNPETYRQILKEELDAAINVATRKGDTEDLEIILKRYGMEADARELDRIIHTAGLEAFDRASKNLQEWTAGIHKALDNLLENDPYLSISRQDLNELWYLAFDKEHHRPELRGAARDSYFIKRAGEVLGVGQSEVRELFRMMRHISKGEAGDMSGVAAAELMGKMLLMFSHSMESKVSALYGHLASIFGLADIEEVKNLPKLFRKELEVYRKNLEKIGARNSGIGVVRSLIDSLERSLITPNFDAPGDLAEAVQKTINSLSRVKPDGKPEAIMYGDLNEALTSFFESRFKGWLGSDSFVVGVNQFEKTDVPTLFYGALHQAAEVQRSLGRQMTAVASEAREAFTEISERLEKHAAMADALRGLLERELQIRASHEYSEKLYKQVMKYQTQRTKKPLKVAKRDLPVVVQEMLKKSPNTMALLEAIENQIEKTITEVRELTAKKDFQNADEIAESLTDLVNLHDSLRKVAMARSGMFDLVKQKPKPTGGYSAKLHEKVAVTDAATGEIKYVKGRPLKILLHGTSSPDLKVGDRFLADNEMMPYIRNYATSPGGGVYFSEDLEIAYFYANIAGWHGHSVGVGKAPVPKLLVAGMDPDARVLDLVWENADEYTEYITEMKKRQNQILDLVEESSRRALVSMSSPENAGIGAADLYNLVFNRFDATGASFGVRPDPWRMADDIVKAWESGYGRKLSAESTDELLGVLDEAVEDMFNEDFFSLLNDYRIFDSPSISIFQNAEAAGMFEAAGGSFQEHLIDRFNKLSKSGKLERITEKPVKRRLERAPYAKAILDTFKKFLREDIETIRKEGIQPYPKQTLVGAPFIEGLAHTVGTKHGASSKPGSTLLNPIDFQMAMNRAAVRTYATIFDESTNKAIFGRPVSPNNLVKEGRVGATTGDMVKFIELMGNAPNQIVAAVWGRSLWPTWLKKAGYVGTRGVETKPFFTVETVIYDTSRLTPSMDATLAIQSGQGYKPIMAKAQATAAVAEQVGLANKKKLLAPDIDTVVNKEAIRANWLKRMQALPKEAQAIIVEREMASVRNIQDLEVFLRKYWPVLEDLDPRLVEKASALYRDDVVSKAGHKIIDPKRLDYAGQPYVTHTWRHGPMKGQTLTLPKGIAQDLANYDGIWQQNPELQSALKVLDFVNNTFKLSFTKYYPSFNNRNIFSNALASAADILVQAINPVTHYRAIKILSGAGGTYKDAFGNTILGAQIYNEMLALGINTDKILLSEMVGRGNRLDIPEWIARKLKIESAKPVHFFLNAPQYIENEARAVHFITLRMRGYSPADAAYNVNKFLFDYTDLSPFERNVMRRLVPFYTWMRKNTQLQIENLVERPGYVSVQSKLLTRERGPAADALPDYVRGQAIVELYEDTDGAAYLNNIDVPVSNMDVLWAGGVGKTLREHLSMIHPYIKAPLEFAYGLDSYTGQSVKGRMFMGRVGPAMDRNLPTWAKEWIELEHYTNQQGEKVYKANGTKVFVLYKMMLMGRFVSEGATIDNFMTEMGQGDMRAGATAMLRFLTGLQLREFNFTEAQRARLMNRTARLEDYLYDKGYLVEFRKRYPDKQKVLQETLRRSGSGSE